MYGDINELFTFLIEAVGIAFGVCLLIGFIVWSVMYVLQAFKDISQS